MQTITAKQSAYLKELRNAIKTNFEGLLERDMFFDELAPFQGKQKYTDVVSGWEQMGHDEQNDIKKRTFALLVKNLLLSDEQIDKLDKEDASWAIDIYKGEASNKWLLAVNISVQTGTRPATFTAVSAIANNTWVALVKAVSTPCVV